MQTDIQSNQLNEPSFSSLSKSPEITAKWQPDFSNLKMNSDNYIPFFKWAKWSPDGSAILTNSSDHILRLWYLDENVYSTKRDQNPSQFSSHVEFARSESIFDLDWYPFQNYHDISTRSFIKSTKQHPIQLCNMDNGLAYGNYIVLDDKEQMVTSQCVKFSPDGSKIYGGSLNRICIFDTSIPGKNGKNVLTKSTRKSKNGQSGIISCIDFNAQNGSVFSLGSFSNSIGLYDERTLQLAYLINSLPNGVTDVKFSPDGRYLFGGCRMDSWIYCWDLRNLQAPISKLERPLKTHQRIYFDINSRSNELITGDEGGYLRVYDINKIGEKDQISPTYLHKLHNDSIPISRYHPYLPLIFTCSGSRDLAQDKISEFSLNIWKLE